MSALSASSGVFVGLGRFFFRFGLMSFIVSFLVISVFSSLNYVYGGFIPSIVLEMSRLFSLSLFIGGGVALVALAVGRVIIPSILQGVGLAQYLAFAVPSASGIIYVSQLLVSYASFLPHHFVAGLSAFLSTFGVFTIIYYLAYRLGVLPEE